MTTLYAYWDTTRDQVVASTIATSRKEAGEKLIDLVGELQAIQLVGKNGYLFITEIEVKRVKR